MMAGDATDNEDGDPMRLGLGISEAEAAQLENEAQASGSGLPSFLSAKFIAQEEERHELFSSVSFASESNFGSDLMVRGWGMNIGDLSLVERTPAKGDEELTYDLQEEVKFD